MNAKDFIEEALQRFLEPYGDMDDIPHAALKTFEVRLNQVMREHWNDPPPPWVVLAVDKEDHKITIDVADDPEEAQQHFAEMTQDLGAMLDVIQVDPQAHSVPADDADVEGMYFPTLPDGTPDYENFPCVFMHMQGTIGLCSGIVETFEREGKVAGAYGMRMRLCENHRKALEGGELDDLLPT